MMAFGGSGQAEETYLFCFEYYRLYSFKEDTWLPQLNEVEKAETNEAQSGHFWHLGAVAE